MLYLTLLLNTRGQRPKSKQSNGHIEKVIRFEECRLSPVGSSSTAERVKSVRKSFTSLTIFLYRN